MYTERDIQNTFNQARPTKSNNYITTKTHYMVRTYADPKAGRTEITNLGTYPTMDEARAKWEEARNEYDACFIEKVIITKEVTKIGKNSMYGEQIVNMRKLEEIEKEMAEERKAQETTKVV